MTYYIALAFIALIVEFSTGTFWLLPCAVVLFGVALLIHIAPDASVGMQALTMLMLGLVCFPLAKFLKSKTQKHEDNSLNNPLTKYVGYNGVVTKAFEDGKGEVSVADSLWEAQCKSHHSLEKGTVIKVLKTHESSILEVEPE
ncbi:NfeD family protein [Pseudomonas luteola]